MSLERGGRMAHLPPCFVWVLGAGFPWEQRGLGCCPLTVEHSGPSRLRPPGALTAPSSSRLYVLLISLFTEGQRPSGTSAYKLHPITLLITVFSGVK